MNFITGSCFVMFTAVALGALGAHALRPSLEPLGRVEAWETAVLYHLVHGLALFGVGIWRRQDIRAQRSRAVGSAGWLWLAGAGLFSGSLYLLSFGGPRWLGPITPIGGVCFLVGWISLAFGSIRLSRRTSTQ